jgi:ATP-binding cassette, subfamily B (MDR/TAP), member 1
MASSTATQEIQPPRGEVSVNVPVPEAHGIAPHLTEEPQPAEVDAVSLSAAKNPTWFHTFSQVPRDFVRRVRKRNPSRTSYFTLYRPLKDTSSRLILAAGIILAVAAGVPLPLIGYIFGEIINSFPPEEGELETRLFQLIGIAAAYFIITWGWSTAWGVVGERVSRGLREELVEKAMGMDMTYFDVESPDMANILTEKTQTVQLGTSEKVGIFIASMSYFTAAFIVGLVLDAKLTGIIVAVVIPSMSIIVYLGSSNSGKFAKAAGEHTAKASALAESAIKGVQVVQAFGILNQLADDHLAMLKNSTRLGIKKALSGAVMLGSIYFVAYSTNSLAFWYGSQESEGKGATGAGTVFAVVFLILDASFVVGQFGPFIQIFALAASAGDKIFELLDHPDPAINVYSTEGAPVTTACFKDDIQFRDIDFKYPARKEVPILEKFNLTFKSGYVTGMVGSSGSGKSTIAAMLLRLYDPESGQVLVGGKDIRDFNLRSLRSHIRLVDQDPKLFSGTILDNLSYGLGDDHNLSQEEVLERCKQAAREASCEFVFELPEGMDTPVTGSGVAQLSGGQKQRLCLARALAARPALLILDEYTSAMDATNEARVLAALQKSAKETGRTTIVIAHRLATVKDADEIVVMSHGTVAEKGTHEFLMKSDGLYRQLIEAQKFDKTDPGTTPASTSSGSMAKTVDDVAVETDEESSTPASEDEVVEPSRLSMFQVLRRCFALSKPELPFVIAGFTASILSGAAIIGEAIVFGSLVQALNDPDMSNFHDHVNFLCLMFFILALIVLVTNSTSGTAFGVVSESLIVRVRDISLRTILGQDLTWFSNRKRSPHALMSTLNMDSGSLSGLSGVIIGTIFSATTSTLCGIILAHVVAWKIAIVLLAAVPIMLLAGFLRLKVIAKTEERHQTCYNDAAALASEACGSIRTVAALGREKGVLQQYRDAIKEPYEQSLKFTALSNILLGLSLSLTYFVYALAYWW